jgi:heme exporter protein C
LTAPTSTSSPSTRVLGAVVLVGLALHVWLSLVASPADVNQKDSVRLLYLHVPSANMMFLGCGLTTVASALYLWRRSTGWDVLAGAAAEVGLVFTGITLFTGMVWGRPTWGVYWVWDARLTSTAMLFVLLLGYLALRRVPGDPDLRAKRSAIVGLLLVPNVALVHFSVDWWRTLHQSATLTLPNAQIDGLMLFTLMYGMVLFAGVFAWLLVHRFRVGWLEERLERGGLDVAIAERRAEASPVRSSTDGGVIA